MGASDERAWVALIKSLIRTSLLILSPTKVFCQSELSGLLYLEITFLLILMAGAAFFSRVLGMWDEFYGHLVGAQHGNLVHPA